MNKKHKKRALLAAALLLVLLLGGYFVASPWLVLARFKDNARARHAEKMGSCRKFRICLLSEAPDQGIDKTINSISRNKPPAIDLKLRFEFSLQGPPDQQRNEQAYTVYGVVDQEADGKQNSDRKSTV